MINLNDILDNFDKELAEHTTKYGIANENKSRPYITGILNDVKNDEDHVLLTTMSQHNRATMPIVNRGKPPAQDDLPDTKMQQVKLMPF